MKAVILEELAAIEPLDEVERHHLADARAWIESDAELCRLRKPATPAKHLVAYFPVLEERHILLVNHRNAGLWLPTGGHVEPGEHPRAAVRRELREELGMDYSASAIDPPLMITVTSTIGPDSHVDVSLWYAVRGRRHDPVNFDGIEFEDANWFRFDDLPLNRTDPHLSRFISKWIALT